MPRAEVDHALPNDEPAEASAQALPPASVDLRGREARMHVHYAVQSERLDTSKRCAHITPLRSRIQSIWSMIAGRHCPTSSNGH